MFLLEHPFLGQFSFELLPLVLQHLSDLALQAPVLANSPWEEDFEKHMRSWVPSTAAVPAPSLFLVRGEAAVTQVVCFPQKIADTQKTNRGRHSPGPWAPKMTERQPQGRLSWHL